MTDKLKLKSYFYLGTPYSKFKAGKEAAFRAAVEQNALLIRAGWNVYSPIVHCHPMFASGLVPSGDWEFWQDFNRSMIQQSSLMLVCKLDGWADSIGLMGELAYCASIRREVVYMTPGEVPII